MKRPDRVKDILEICFGSILNLDLAQNRTPVKSGLPGEVFHLKQNSMYRIILNRIQRREAYFVKYSRN